MKTAWLGTAATNAAILVSGIATGVLAARLLGPEDRGLFAAVLFWPQTIAGLASLSLGEALIARHARAGHTVDRLVASAGLAALGLALAGFVLGAPLLPVLLGAGRAEAVPLATAYLAAFLPLSALATVLLARDQAEQRFLRLNLLRLGPSWIYLAGIVVLWASDAIGVDTLLWATWFGSALTVAARLGFARRSLLARPSTEQLRDLLTLGSKFHAGAVVALLAAQADRMLLFVAFDDATAGHYVVAATFASSGLAVVTSAVAFVLQPVIAAEPDRAGARALLATALRRTALFLYLGAAAGVAVTPWLLPLLFGPAFADAVPICMLLLLAVVPLTLRQTIVRCLRGFGEARIGVTSELAALAGFLLAAGPALWLGGVAGLAAATILGNLAGLLVCARHLAKAHAIAPRAWLAPGPTMIRDGWRLAHRLAVSGLVR